MCKGISMIITKGRILPFVLSGENSHTKIRDYFNIPEDTNLEPRTLPIEFLPTGCLTHPDEWQFTIDSNCEIPSWYLENEKEYKANCKAALIVEIEKIQKTGEYSGSIDLRWTGVTSLGNLQSVGGDLDLIGTGITLTKAERKKFTIAK